MKGRNEHDHIPGKRQSAHLVQLNTGPERRVTLGNEICEKPFPSTSHWFSGLQVPIWVSEPVRNTC